ncbi:CDP-6-deoxy-delta-3,4-glucoseen reductase [Kaistia algarum]|uniref:2Fe-2S iron-sulfur cluster-binding protein n=1 Tax=Kaistia algarum TaxID=2083279 RepID=UPI000CE8C3A0|nr:2Fe-2S iron-sulfur cluster-binding protein [Kaistia algarum]MCX5516795.1 2Fe-2S iron-sulfur cluster-binding protein [Kaistia algarum]PPE77175.1 CDP-6-deoxy-delta-3,4-glucoseen reductase [Kaistia algarum]
MLHRVTLLDGDLAFDVEPHETLLAAALRAEINLPHDCKSGTCGTCRFKLIEGSVDYAEPPMGLEPEEAEAGFGLACQARPTSDLVVEAELMPSLLPEPMRCQSRVAAVQRLTADVVHLKLALPVGLNLTFLPGQHINILLEDGSARSFSMASRPAADGMIDLHVRQIPGGRFTSGHLGALKPGDALDLELPLGSFFLRDDFRPLILVATGTGLAPIKSIVEALFDDPTPPPVALYWGMRTEADLYLHREIESWAERLEDFRYIPVLSRAGEGWQGRRGYVQDAVVEDVDDLEEHAVYLCGSPGMISSAKHLLIAHGASVNHIYADSFLFQHNRGAD